jgi:hypothetical protein
MLSIGTGARGKFEKKLAKSLDFPIALYYNSISTTNGKRGQTKKALTPGASRVSVSVRSAETSNFWFRRFLFAGKDRVMSNSETVYPIRLPVDVQERVKNAAVLRGIAPRTLAQELIKHGLDQLETGQDLVTCVHRQVRANDARS